MIWHSSLPEFLNINFEVASITLAGVPSLDTLVVLCSLSLLIHLLCEGYDPFRPDMRWVHVNNEVGNNS